MTEIILFYLFSGLAVIFSLLAIFLKSPIKALLSLLVTLLSLAIIFTLLGAYLITMIHIVVYAGAILVLFLFVIMLQGLGASDTPLFQRFSKPLLFSLLLAPVLLFLIFLSALARSPKLLAASEKVHGTVEAIGRLLFTDYLLPFELTSFVLLLGVFAAIALAKKEPSS